MTPRDNFNVFTIVPNWNGEDLLAESLRSLQKQSYSHTIVVVDNGSTDNSRKILANDFSEVHVIKLPKNLGFSGGVNVGIRYALGKGADAIALFNNDAAADSAWLSTLVSQMLSDQSCGIVTGKFMRTDGVHIDSTGDFYSIWGVPFPRGRNQKDNGQYEKVETVFGATGGASLYRAAMLEDIGLFDENFFAYYEDVDISFRAQLAGWKIVYVPTAVAYHKVSATSSRLGTFTRYHSTKNFYLLFLKNMPGKLFWKYLPLFGLYALRLSISSIVRRYFITYVRGVVAALFLLPGVVRERRTSKINRKVSIDYIDSLLYKHQPPKIPSL